METSRALGVLSMSLAFCLGCEHEEQREPPATVASGGNCPCAGAAPAAPRVADESATGMGVTEMQSPNADALLVERVSVARCDREAACNAIGDVQQYVWRQGCMDRMRRAMALDLSSYSCAHGHDRMAIERCLSAIRAQPCGDRVDAFDRLAQCHTDALCSK